MKHNKKLQMLLIIFTLTASMLIGTALAGPFDCDCDGACASTDDCCGCSTGNYSVHCDLCESDEECETGTMVVREGGVDYPAYCKDKC